MTYAIGKSRSAGTAKRSAVYVLAGTERRTRRIWVERKRVRFYSLSRLRRRFVIANLIGVALLALNALGLFAYVILMQRAIAWLMEALTDDSW